MTRYRERPERLRDLKAMMAFAKLFPGLCLTCKQPCTKVRQITLVDFMGGTGEDATLEVAMCDACAQSATHATNAILTSKARRD